MLARTSLIALLALVGCSSNDAIPSDDGGVTTETGTGADGANDAASSPDGGPQVNPNSSCTQPPSGTNAPDLPQAFVDTTLVPPTGKTITVNAGGNLQAALDSAALGDVIMLEAGASFTGTFTLPEKTSGSGWITIQTNTQLPAPGTRMTPSAAASAKLAKIQGTGAPVIAFQTVSRAHHFRFIGVEISPAPGQFATALIRLGGAETVASDLPHHLIFDRTYIHGDATLGGRRGIMLNSASTAIIDSWFSDWKEVGADSQAIAGWNGSGPYRIVNNYLEGAGENLVFGGADPSIPNQIPSDIEICHNHFSKPLTWKADDPSYAGTAWSVKNIFELKLGRRILVADNVFEHSWPMAQVGFALNIKSANQGGTAPWSITEHVTFVNNVIRKAASGAGLNGADPNTPLRTQHLRFVNNVFTEIGVGAFKGDNNLFQIFADKVQIEHNTGFAPNITVNVDGTPSTELVFRDNLFDHGAYGIKGGGTAEGNATLAKFFPGATFTNNALIAYPSASYPTNNFYPANMNAVGFVNASGGDYRLATSSAYVGKASDGKDIGADLDSIAASTTGVIVAP